jgi:hypothetical protein
MSVEPQPEVTRILLDWSRGDPEAPERLMPFVYDLHETRPLLTLYLIVLFIGRRTNETTTAFAFIRIAVAEQTNMINSSSADLRASAS